MVKSEEEIMGYSQTFHKVPRHLKKRAQRMCKSPIYHYTLAQYYASPVITHGQGGGERGVLRGPLRMVVVASSLCMQMLV